MDWIDNITSISKWGWKDILPKDCKVGYGFRRQAKKLCPVVLGILYELANKYPDAKIIVTGHSSAAVITPLIVAYLMWHGIKVHYAVCHESPRPGNRAFAEWYSRAFDNFGIPTWSFINVLEGQVDLITRLPKSSWRFWHLIDRRVFFDGDDTLFGEPAWEGYRDANPVPNYKAAWRIFSNSWKRRVDSIRAHLGTEIIKAWKLRLKRTFERR